MSCGLSRPHRRNGLCRPHGGYIRSKQGCPWRHTGYARKRKGRVEKKLHIGIIAIQEDRQIMPGALRCQPARSRRHRRALLNKTLQS